MSNGDEFTSLPKQKAEEAKNGTVYVQLDIREDILKPLTKVEARLDAMHGALRGLVSQEELHAHTDQFAHSRLVRSMKWATGTLLAFGSLGLAIFAAAR